MLPNPVNWEAELHRTASITCMSPKEPGFLAEGNMAFAGSNGEFT